MQILIIRKPAGSDVLLTDVRKLSRSRNIFDCKLRGQHRRIEIVVAHDLADVIDVEKNVLLFTVPRVAIQCGCPITAVVPTAYMRRCRMRMR